MKESGVTLIETIAVLLIMGIVSAVAISRFANLEDMETATRVTTVRNHIRYAQIMAMKRNDRIWGIKCDGNEYWIFRIDKADTTDANAPGLTGNITYLPGNEAEKIPISNMDDFTLYFDGFGIPYIFDSGITDIKAIDSPEPIQIGSRTLTVTPETGFIE